MAISKSTAKTKQSSGKKCPHCGAMISPAPKRARKCPKCKQQIRVRKGRLFTEEVFLRNQKNEHNKTMRAITTQNIKSYLGSGVAAVQIMGTKDAMTCDACKKRAGKVIDIRSAVKNPKSLPPFADCTSDICRCSIMPVVATPRRKTAKSRKGCLFILGMAVLALILFGNILFG